MAKPFLTDDSKAALTQAVREVESCCSAELVVAVRPKSGSYLHADVIAGSAVAFASLAFLLFSPWEFGLFWLLFDPLAAGLLGGLIASRFPGLRRALTPRAVRRRQVETAARSTFVENRVHRTAGRTGILLYISVLEREAVVVPDLGVETVATTEAWTRTVTDIADAVRQGEDGAQVARLITDLKPVLAPALARSAQDVDELANEVCE